MAASVDFGIFNAMEIALSVRPSILIALAFATVSGSILGGRPQEPPSASIRSRAAAIRSPSANLSILAAQAITEMMISAAGPLKSNPSATLTTSIPAVRSPSRVVNVSAMPVRVRQSNRNK